MYARLLRWRKPKQQPKQKQLLIQRKLKYSMSTWIPLQLRWLVFLGDDGKWVKGIEDYLPTAQYLSPEHQNKVVEDIQDNWLTLSHNGKFHAIFATSSIPEAIDYYRLLKAAMPKLRTSCLFDPNISNEDGDYKEYKGQPVAFLQSKV